jgi:hypothetical protein
MGQVWSNGNKGQNENTSETKPENQPHENLPIFDEMQLDALGVLVSIGRESAPFLPSDIAALEMSQIAQDKPPSPSPALEDQSRRALPLNAVAADKAAREAALVEVLRTFESPSVPSAQSESEPEAPKKAFGWQHRAVLALLSLGVLGLLQPRSRNRAAPKFKTAKT